VYVHNLNIILTFNKYTPKD